MNLKEYARVQHTRSASLGKLFSWYLINALLFDSWLLPFYTIKRIVLRFFGAKIGDGVIIKPRVNIKYPWKLTIGNQTWIGEGVWIDNLALVTIGADCCISQGVYLCTGNHDWSDPRFALITREIVIENQAWIGAFSTICPGVTISEGSVLAAGSVVTKDTKAWTISAGNPAEFVKDRILQQHEECHFSPRQCTSHGDQQEKPFSLL
ncbi:MAG: colanic acid biosynthesis acetyltransferase WcaF [Candidatus Tectomicrobia bacterium]|nr:colanic acid biosynthesis acetyltransferase WcaF [Candidatus Tectomicrobia bacterium]